MTTSIDSNILISLWDPLPAISDPPKTILNKIRFTNRLVVCASVYAELVAGPGRSEKQIDLMLQAMRIEVDWHMSEEVWRLAGLRFNIFAEMRRKQTQVHPRRILADFIIGAHAERNSYTLLTVDRLVYSRSFPKVKLVDF